jgi:hypothetical protein
MSDNWRVPFFLQRRLGIPDALQSRLEDLAALGYPERAGAWARAGALLQVWQLGRAL